MHPPRTHLTIPVGAPMSEPGIIRETSTKAGHRVTLAIEYASHGRMIESPVGPTASVLRRAVSLDRVPEDLTVDG